MTTNELIEKGIGHNCLSDAYDLGRADMLDSIILAVKDNYYCLEDLCGESMECSDCMVTYLELLKEKK